MEGPPQVIVVDAQKGKNKRKPLSKKLKGENKEEELSPNRVDPTPKVRVDKAILFCNVGVKCLGDFGTSYIHVIATSTKLKKII